MCGIVVISNSQSNHTIVVHVLKRHSVLLAQVLVLVTCAFLSQGWVSSHAIAGWDVVINEFDPNPPSGPQWVELFNPADAPRDLSLWMIVTQSSWIVHVLEGGATIEAKGYVVVHLTLPMIDPAGDLVILKDRNYLEIDKTPLLSKPVKSGNAWARIPNGVDTDSILDWKFQPATKGVSNTAPMPPPIISTILCALSSNQVEIGSSVTVSVIITPPRSTPVTIQVRKAGEASWSNLTTALTEVSGVYTYSWTPETMGMYGVRAYVYPSDSFPELYSPPIGLPVTKIRTYVSCFTTRFGIVLGGSLATYGYILPAIEGVNVILTYRKPTDAPIVRYILIESGGLYNDTSFTPQEAGSWNVTASWEGDENHTAASSPLVSFNVEQPPAPPFGMWLIISLVVSVTIAAVVLAAGLSSRVVSKPPRRVALCPQCRSPLLYVPSIRGWHCPRCKRHF